MIVILIRLQFPDITDLHSLFLNLFQNRKEINKIFKDKCDACAANKFTNEPGCNYVADISNRILDGDRSYFIAGSFEECVTLCEEKSNCMAVGYKMSVYQCFLKSNVKSHECGPEISDHSGIKCSEDLKCKGYYYFWNKIRGISHCT
jgi:hypothetical protein